MTIVFDFVYEIYDNDNGSAILHYLKKICHSPFFLHLLFEIPLVLDPTIFMKWHCHKNGEKYRVQTLNSVTLKLTLKIQV